MSSVAGQTEVRLEEELSVLAVAGGRVGETRKMIPWNSKGEITPHPDPDTPNQRNDPFLGEAHP